MPLSQVQFTWAGWSGAPGYTSFYIADADPTALQDFADTARTFFNGIAGYIPSGVTIGAPSTARKFDAVTGDLVDVVPITTPPASVAGSGAAYFSAVSGAVVSWLTATPAASRLVVGRTYLVPLSDTVYQTDGTIADSVRVDIASKAATFAAANDPLFCVWRRPVDGAGGSAAPVVAARCGDKVSVMKSRRD